MDEKKTGEYIPFKCSKCGKEHEINLSKETENGNFTFTCTCGKTVSIGAKADKFIQGMTDNMAVFFFSKEMMLMLEKKQKLGRHGWEHSSICSIEMLENMLREQFQKYQRTKDTKHLIHIGNFCMMLFHRKARRREAVK